MSNQSRPGLGVPLLVLLALLTALDSMAIDTYLPGLPAIAADFGAPAARVQQTLVVFLIGLAMGQAVYGPLLDRYGRRTPLLAGIGIFTAGSALAALAPSLEGLMLARFIQALGAAAGLVAPRAIVTDLCDLRASARVFSLLMQIMTLSPILAPVLGGIILDHGGWRAAFWWLTAVGATGFLWCLRSIPDSRPAGFDAGAGLCAAITAYGRLAREPAFLARTLAGGFLLGGLFVYLGGSSFVFIETFGLTPRAFSYVFAANAVGFIIGGQIADMMHRCGWSAGRVMYLGLAAQGTAGIILSLCLWGMAPSPWIFAGLLAATLTAAGLIIGNLTALTMAGSGDRAGTASSFMGTVQYLAGALIGAVPAAFPATLAAIPLTIALCAAAAIIACLAADRWDQRSGAPAIP